MSQIYKPGSGGGEGGGYTWVLQSSAFTPQTGYGYLITAGSRVTATLPASPSLGYNFAIIDVGGNGWKIAQLAGQSIQLADLHTATGAAGSLTSSKIGDSMEIVCWAVGPGSSWVVINANGNIVVA